MWKEHEGLEYNPLQQEAFKFVGKDCNLVVEAPTSSGKTYVAEMFLLEALYAGKKALYLSPLKALTHEKLVDWEERLGEWSIVAITSDHMRHPRPITERLILMTTEALDSKTRGARQWLKNIGCIVCDEAHLLGVPRRGDAFEIGLTRFATINPAARIIFLSATLPNVESISRWLTSLNNKPTEVVSSSWRPVEIEDVLIPLPQREWLFNAHALRTIRRIFAKHPKEQILVFVHTIAKGKMIARELNIPFHYSKLSKEDRHSLEERFRRKQIMRMVSTSTLAYGVNLPADVGIIVGAHRGMHLVEPWDLKQMRGRIGRYGLSSKGTVYFLFRGDYAEAVWDTLQSMPAVMSQLPKRLYFHVVSFVAREGMQPPQIASFLERTLASEQGLLSGQHVADAIELLLEYGALRREGEELVATNLGRAAALMYLDPVDLWHLRKNLRDKPMTPSLIAKAFADIPCNEVETWVPDDINVEIDMPYGRQTLVANALLKWLRGDPLSGVLKIVQAELVQDIERWLSGLAIAGLDKSYVQRLGLCMLRGVPMSASELVQIKGIGRAKAVALLREGIRTQKELLEKADVARKAIGSKTYEKVVAELTREKGRTIIIW